METTEQPVETPQTLETEPVRELTLEQKTFLYFEGSAQKFLEKLNNYKGAKKQIQRAWSNSTIHPFDKGQLHFSYPEEKELFDLYTDVNSTKLMLILLSLQKEGKITLSVEFEAYLNETEKKEETKNG